MTENADLKFTHIFTQDRSNKTLDSCYTIEKSMLGEGSYGQVVKGIDKQTSQVRAIKAIDKAKIADKARFETEIEIQQSLTHPNIVKLYEHFRDKKRFYLVMELCSGGELFDRIVEEAEQHEGRAFEEVKAASIMEQILGAINYMHEKHFAHRDIKPENFLLQDQSPDAPIKVIDFGLAKQFVPGESNLRTKAGTPYYVAPQVLGSTGYNEKCDVWSCGVLTYIILCGYPPFYGDRDNDILRMVKSGAFDFPRPDWDTISKEAKDFIVLMLTFDAAKRPSAGKMLTDPWLKRTPSGAGVQLSKDLGSRLRKFTGESKMKKAVLTLIAQQLKEDDIQEMKDTFSALDVNKDGTLAAEEILEGMKKHRLAIPSDIERTLHSLDTDGSGTIDYDEFIAATLSTQQYLKREVLWSAFRVFDTDGSGEIEAHELKEVFKDGSLAQIEKIIKEVDINCDGKISFDEFCTMMGMQHDAK